MSQTEESPRKATDWSSVARLIKPLGKNPARVAVGKKGGLKAQARKALTMQKVKRFLGNYRYVALGLTAVAGLGYLAYPSYDQSSSETDIAPKRAEGAPDDSDNESLGTTLRRGNGQRK